MNQNLKAITHSYRIQGAGGQGVCLAVQSVLQEHGLCGYTEWMSPEWRFLCLTYLEHDTIVSLLGDLSERFKVKIAQELPYSIPAAVLRDADSVDADPLYVGLSQARLEGVNLMPPDLNAVGPNGVNGEGRLEAPLT